MKEHTHDIELSTDEKQKKLEVIVSVLEYLQQIEKNRYLVEKCYFESDTPSAKQHFQELMNGFVWIEYTVALLDMNIDPDEKNRLFVGVAEAIEMDDWLTLMDFLSYPLVRYIELTREAFLKTYSEINGDFI
ncbi:hypothetical protein [Paenibacillus alginolyticus]|uniref:DUF1878 domain-containing protein n=1 Tax=Paenibacillus alginolyticus TaxID=59839 RepID=A0ABT4G853_9BACL|nr:hypothetical protein [Paenibacillus alginolyticus]MCY9692359.1 hypothetical protein [Paenibacillus alginolyticus]